MSRLTNSDLISTSYSPWELCGLDEDCLGSCQDCHIAKMYRKLAAYEDIGFSPEELQELIDKQKWHVVADGDLPEEVGNYLVIVERIFFGGNYPRGKVVREVSKGYFQRDDSYIAGYVWCSDCAGVDNSVGDGRVLAWRELPEPWEGAMK